MHKDQVGAVKIVVFVLYSFGLTFEGISGPLLYLLERLILWLCLVIFEYFVGRRL